MLKNNTFDTAIEQVINQSWISDKTKIRIYIHKEIISEDGTILDLDKCWVGTWFSDKILEIITDERMSSMMTDYSYDVKNDVLRINIFER